MLTDVSSEMVNSIVPLFLTFQLGFSRFQFGLFNGVYQVLAAATALIGGAVADRHRRYKEVAGIGYGVSAATRVGLVVAQNAWVPATGMLYADRAAKGLRTAPRDALISQSALPGRLGEAFGVHRALDTLGALIGPILAFVLLSAVPGGYDVIFRASFWIALGGLAVLVLARAQPPGKSQAMARRSIPPARSPSVAPSDSLRLPEYRRLVCAGSALSLVTIADAFVYATFQQRSSMTTRFFPLLYVGTALAYLFLALPLGPPGRSHRRDQGLRRRSGVALGRRRHAPHQRSGTAGLDLHARRPRHLLRRHRRHSRRGRHQHLARPTTGQRTGPLGAAMALAAFAASTVFGALWQWKGPTFAVAVFLVGLVVSLVAALALLGPQLRRERSGVVANSFG